MALFNFDINDSWIFLVLVFDTMYATLNAFETSSAKTPIKSWNR